MPPLMAVFANGLFASFVVCCIVSGLLQVVAWTRHARDGVPVSIRALWRPEGIFDEIGLRQIALARRLLTVGAVAYLTYGALVAVGNVL